MIVEVPNGTSILQELIQKRKIPDEDLKLCKQKRGFGSIEKSDCGFVNDWNLWVKIKGIKGFLPVNKAVESVDNLCKSTILEKLR